MKRKSTAALFSPIICAVIMAGGLYACTAAPQRRYCDLNQRHPHTVFIMKSYWHTGIIFAVDEVSGGYIEALKDFDGYRYVDIGWGDEDFYQSDDPGFCLGAKAILVPSSSVVRIEGFSKNAEEVARWSDFAIRFTLSDEEFRRLCLHIDGSFRKDKNGRLMITSRRGQGEIIFYKSGLKYHLCHTCNTWVVRGFNEAGFKVSPSGVITARRLFKRLRGFGMVLKSE